MSWGAIRDYHINVKGWIDIGYHFGVEAVNDQIEILMGRMPNRVGAHIQWHNRGSIGICVVGDYDKEELGLGRKKALAELLRWLMIAYKIPLKNIYGHRDFNAMKSCPGKDLYDFVRILKGGNRGEGR